LWDLDVSFDGSVQYRDINHIDDVRLERNKSVIVIESNKCDIRTSLLEKQVVQYLVE
jgi:hypothetical protein